MEKIREPLRRRSDEVSICMPGHASTKSDRRSRSFDESENVEMVDNYMKISRNRVESDAGFQSSQTLAFHPEEGISSSLTEHEKIYVSDSPMYDDISMDDMDGVERDASRTIEFSTKPYKRHYMYHRKPPETLPVQSLPNGTVSAVDKYPRLVAVATSKDDSRLAQLPEDGQMYSYAPDDDQRRGSAFSYLSHEYNESQRNDSVDSAVDGLNWYPRSKSIQSRLSVHAPIPEATVQEIDAALSLTANRSDALGHPSLENPSTETSSLKSATLMPKDDPEDTDENLSCRKSFKKSDSQTSNFILRLFRLVFRIVSICIKKPRPSGSSEETFVNCAYIQDGDTDSNQLRDCVDCDPQQDVEQIKQASVAPSKFTLDKQTMLNSFDRMCSKALDMGHDVTGRFVQIDNFAAAMLDSRGGWLSLDDLDVHLNVPPGAISPSSPPQRVYIFAQGNSTAGSHSWLTPYVNCGCGPSGSQFKFSKDVVLTLPHNATDRHNNEIYCVKSLSGGEVRPIRNGEDGVVLAGSKFITLTMDHFCGIAAHRKVSAKSMLACVFIPERLRREKETITIRVRLLNNLKVNRMEVEREEKEFGFVPVSHPLQELHVKNSEKGVVMDLRSMTDTWEIFDPPSGKQTLEASYLWREDSLESVTVFPFKTFIAKRCSLHPEEGAPVKAKLKIFQDSWESHGVEFLLDEVADVKPQRPIKIIASTNELDDSVLKALTTPIDDVDQILSDQIRDKLRDLLDCDMGVVNDWHLLCEELLGESNYKSIETRAGYNRSPTELVLDTFFTASKAKGMSKADILQKLKRALLNMKAKRPDVKSVIDGIQKQMPQNRCDSSYYSVCLE